MKEKRVIQARVSPEIHEKLRLLTALADQTINTVVERLISEEYKRKRKDVEAMVSRHKNDNSKRE